MWEWLFTVIYLEATGTAGSCSRPVVTSVTGVSLFVRSYAVHGALSHFRGDGM
jgi:hypothetical protein